MFRTAVKGFHFKLVLTSFVFVQRRFCSLSHVKVPLRRDISAPNKYEGKALLIRKSAPLKYQLVLSGWQRQVSRVQHSVCELY